MLNVIAVKFGQLLKQLNLGEKVWKWNGKQKKFGQQLHWKGLGAERVVWASSLSHPVPSKEFKIVKTHLKSLQGKVIKAFNVESWGQTHLASRP